MDILNQFYNDEHAREAVKAFFLAELDKIALENVYEGKETNGIKDAKETIERSFILLGELYGKQKQKETINFAR